MNFEQNLMEKTAYCENVLHCTLIFRLLTVSREATDVQAL